MWTNTIRSKAGPPFKRTLGVNTNGWIDVPEKPTALRHGAARRGQYNNRVPRPGRPTSRFRYVQGPVPEPKRVDVDDAPVGIWPAARPATTQDPPCHPPCPPPSSSPPSPRPPPAAAPRPPPTPPPAP